MAASKLGGKVKIWSPNGSEENEAFETQKLKWKGTHGIIASWKLVKEIQNYLNKSNIDEIFHLAELGSTRAFLRFGWKIQKKIRLILTIHGSEIPRFTRNPIEKWLFKRLLLKCERIHVLSKFNKKKLTDFCPSTEASICLLSGAPASRVINQFPSSDGLKRENGIQILCVGRIHPRKGQDQILLALNGLHLDEQKKIVVHFAGPKTKPKFFNNLIKISKKFAGKVIFHGDCTDNDLRHLYSSSDIFILTSMPRAKSVEGFGFVYIEASSYGLPIIANRTGGVEDAVKEGETGLLSEPGDILGLSLLLEKLINDHKLRERLGKKGKTWTKTLSWEDVAKKLYDFN